MGDFLLESAAPVMARTLQLARGVAPTPATVLLTGESGTGKEVLARHVHDASTRANGPFVALNCGAVTASLAESELFGHERGAFSGATERRVGRFEAAHAGTLLLDEISELPHDLQVKLLRVLQEREISRVGSSTSVAVDVRIIATSNRDLRQLVDAGEFREDLYYRLNVFPIHLPPLRDRLADVPALCATLAKRQARRFDRPPGAIGDDAFARLRGYHWPGNIRELGNVIERALVLSCGAAIAAKHIHLDHEVGTHELPGRSCPPGKIDPLSQLRLLGGGETLSDLEREAILAILAICDGNRTHASRRLGISLRTLRNRLREYRQQGITVPGPQAPRLTG